MHSPMQHTPFLYKDSFALYLCNTCTKSTNKNIINANSKNKDFLL